MKTQREKILEKLKQGSLNSYTATFELRIKQAPTRVKELKEMGYKIDSIPQNDRSVDWVLLEIPESERPYKYIVENGIARKVYQ